MNPLDVPWVPLAQHRIILTEVLMPLIIDQHRTELQALCRRFQVKTLELFGSATDGRFDSHRSDLDFLVDFLPMPPGPHSQAYFGLLFALEDLFSSKIDLVELQAVRNPYFMKSVNESRQLIYAA
jgi:predicted nucleotidyltransferase